MGHTVERVRRSVGVTRRGKEIRRRLVSSRLIIVEIEQLLPPAALTRIVSPAFSRAREKGKGTRTHILRLLSRHQSSQRRLPCCLTLLRCARRNLVRAEFPPGNEGLYGSVEVKAR